MMPPCLNFVSAPKCQDSVLGVTSDGRTTAHHLHYYTADRDISMHAMHGQCAYRARTRSRAQSIAKRAKVELALYIAIGLKHQLARTALLQRRVSGKPQ